MNTDALNRRLIRLQEEYRALLTPGKQQPAKVNHHVVIYDPISGSPLPGYESPKMGAVFWIPDNGRDKL